MVGVPIVDWRQYLVAGDDLVNDGQIEQAASYYHSALQVIGGDGWEGLLAAALISHRLGICQRLDPGAGLDTTRFAAADDLFERARRLAIDDEDAGAFIEQLIDQSIRHRQRPTQMLASMCPHGCPSITGECTMSRRHC
jgi:hypothetical protein